jgi:hypothetical protein
MDPARPQSGARVSKIANWTLEIEHCFGPRSANFQFAILNGQFAMKERPDDSTCGDHPGGRQEHSDEI